MIPEMKKEKDEKKKRHHNKKKKIIGREGEQYFSKKMGPVTHISKKDRIKIQKEVEQEMLRRAKQKEEADARRAKRAKEKLDETLLVS